MSSILDAVNKDPDRASGSGFGPLPDGFEAPEGPGQGPGGRRWLLIAAVVVVGVGAGAFASRFYEGASLPAPAGLVAGQPVEVARVASDKVPVSGEQPIEPEKDPAKAKAKPPAPPVPTAEKRPLAEKAAGEKGRATAEERAAQRKALRAKASQAEANVQAKDMGALAKDVDVPKAPVANTAPAPDVAAAPPAETSPPKSIPATVEDAPPLRVAALNGDRAKAPSPPVVEKAERGQKPPPPAVVGKAVSQHPLQVASAPPVKRDEGPEALRVAKPKPVLGAEALAPSKKPAASVPTRPALAPPLPPTPKVVEPKVAVDTLAKADPPLSPSAQQRAPHLRGAVLTEAPAGAPAIQLMFIMWARDPGQRMVSLRVAEAGVSIAHEGDTIGHQLSVASIHQDAIDVTWTGRTFRVKVPRF